MTRKPTSSAAPTSRTCDGCTKCCEGYLTGEAFGKTFYPGKPCHFATPGVGCAIYAKRPHDPCVTYQCAWRQDDTLPMWMKPSLIGSIIDQRTTTGGTPYLKVHEAGQRLDSAVLTWLIEYALGNGINLLWAIEGGTHYIGSPDFVAEMDAPPVKA